LIEAEQSETVSYLSIAAYRDSQGNDHLCLCPVGRLRVGPRLEEVDLGENHLVVQPLELLEECIDQSQ
jgi:hypothetical protein